MSKREHISPSLLPSRYRQLDYLESTGTQYIRTNLLSSNGFGWDLNFIFTEVQGNTYIVGSHNTSSPYGRNGVQSAQYGTNYGINTRLWGIGTGDSQKFSYPNYSGVSSITTMVQYNVNQQYHLQGQSVKGDSYLYVDGVLMLQTNDNSIRSDNNILFFTEQYSLNRNVAKTKGRLVGIVNIYIDSINYIFIPALRVSDSKPGLYDIVNNQFYTNAGTGEFLYN